MFENIEKPLEQSKVWCDRKFINCNEKSINPIYYICIAYLVSLNAKKEIRYTYEKPQKKCGMDMHILGHHLKWIYIHIRFFAQTLCWLFIMSNMKKKSKPIYVWMHIQPLCTLLSKTSNVFNQHILKIKKKM